MTTAPKKCRDCNNQSDPQYTLRFDDLGQGPLYWCSECGPFVHSMNDALQDALETRPGFVAQLEFELDGVIQ